MMIARDIIASFHPEYEREGGQNEQKGLGLKVKTPCWFEDKKKCAYHRHKKLG